MTSASDFNDQQECNLCPGSKNSSESSLSLPLGKDVDLMIASSHEWQAAAKSGPANHCQQFVLPVVSETQKLIVVACICSGEAMQCLSSAGWVLG